MATATSSFAEFHQLLREAGVDVVMAGDTHDFEYYREAYQPTAGDRTMHHFVNGGGGAYISIGTALDWPKKTPVPDCAFYPRTDAVIAKLGAEVPPWKTPLWWWVQSLDAWPSSPEVLASAFASNRAPFFQSFVEVQVKPSAGHRAAAARTPPRGRMRWRELQAVRPGDAIRGGTDDFVEFAVPMTARPKSTDAPSGESGAREMSPFANGAVSHGESTHRTRPPSVQSRWRCAAASVMRRRLRITTSVRTIVHVGTATRSNHHGVLEATQVRAHARRTMNIDTRACQ